MEHIDSTILYDQGGHKFLFLGWEEQEEETAVQTNQYVITSGDDVMLLDPGGAHVFPRVLANVAEIVDLRKIRHIFYSHQDPDVSSGITLWLSMAERATVHISGLWVRFLPHFGIYDTKRIAAIPDKGETLPFGKGAAMKLIPSHFLHSTGCFSLFDPVSRVREGMAVLGASIRDHGWLILPEEPAAAPTPAPAAPPAPRSATDTPEEERS